MSRILRPKQKPTNKSILVYAKGPTDKKFTALSSIKTLTYAPTLMYAAIFPYSKLERLKEWCDSVHRFADQHTIQIELRHYKGKAIYKVGYKNPRQ